MNKSKIIFFLKNNKNFFYLWISQALSVITANIMNFLLITKIYEKTSSSVAVSFLWIFYFLPTFFLGPFSGFFVDIINRRKILIFTNIIQSIIVLFYFFIGERIYPIYAIVFLYSLADEFYIPAESSSIPWLVKKKDLPFANSLFLITSQSALILGFGAGGLLIRLSGKNFPIFLSSFFLLLAALAVYRLPQKEQVHKSWSKSLLSFFREIKIGYSFITKTRIILFPILLLILFQLFVTIMGVNIPVFAKDVLNIRLHDSGPLLIVPLGIGALASAYFMTKYNQKIRKRNLMKSGFVITSLVLLFFSTFLPVFGKYKLPLAIPLMFLLGIGGLFINVPNVILVQENTLPNLRGRVFGALGFFTHIVILPFILFTSTIVDLVGVRLFLFISGLLILSLLILFDKAENFILEKYANK